MGHSKGCDQHFYGDDYRRGRRGARPSDTHAAGVYTFSLNTPVLPVALQNALEDPDESPYTKALLISFFMMAQSITPESRRRFYTQLLLVFRPDRTPVVEALAISRVLTQLLSVS